MYLFWLFSFTHSYFLLVLNFQQKQEVKVKLLSLSSQHHIYTSPSIGNLYLYCFLLIRFLLIKICSSFEKMSAQQKLCDTCGIKGLVGYRRPEPKWDWGQSFCLNTTKIGQSSAFKCLWKMLKGFFNQTSSSLFFGCRLPPPVMYRTGGTH